MHVYVVFSQPRRRANPKVSVSVKSFTNAFFTLATALTHYATTTTDGAGSFYMHTHRI
jgi:hypothetical protein